jgi:hypothetical protein
MVAWILGMQQCGPSIPYNNSKWKWQSLPKLDQPLSQMEFQGIIGVINSNIDIHN